MIKIRRTERKDELWTKWRQKCDAERARLQKEDPATIKFKASDLYKRKSVQETYFRAKDGPFRRRCAFCEDSIGNQYGDVEHFRPKQGVTNEKDEPVTIPGKGGTAPIPHPGYFWLSYDETNLLLSCTACNSPAAHGATYGKKNRFPVKGKHAASWREVATEQPLLINPIDPDDEDPEKHLSVDLESGLMIPLSDRGKMCIDIFGLNDREDLLESRREAAEMMLRWYIKCLENVPGAMEKVEAMLAGQYKFTLPRRIQARLSHETAERLRRLQGG